VLKLLDWVVVLALSLPPTISHARQVWIYGSVMKLSCGTWLQRRQDGNWNQMGDWALGFVSGASMYGDLGDPLGQTDANGVFFWLDSYCRLRPDVSFTDGVQAFVDTHKK